MAEIRLLKKSDWPIIEEFNSVQYKPDHILTNKVYYDWQFDNAFNPNKDCYTSLGLFDKKRELAGTIGLFPAPCNFFGQSIKCNWVANLIVKEGLRSLGYGTLLLAEAEKGFGLIVDHNVNDLARPLFEKMGYRAGNIKRYICILDAVHSETVIGRKNLGLQTFKNYDVAFGSGWSTNIIEEFDKNFNEFWERVKSKYRFSIDRSSTYLNWRYAHNPLVRYHILVSYSGNQIASFAVLRIDSVTQEFKRSDTGIRVGRIIDFVATDEVSEYALLEAVKYCFIKGVDFMDFFLTDGFYKKVLDRVGFMDGDVPPYSWMPTLLSPIDRVKRTKHNFAVRLLQDCLDKKTEELNLGYFYTTKGSGDQDRPY